LGRRTRIERKQRFVRKKYRTIWGLLKGLRERPKNSSKTVWTTVLDNMVREEHKEESLRIKRKPETLLERNEES